MKTIILFISILCIIFPSAGIMEAEGFWASLFKLTAKGAQELTQQGMKAIDDLNLNPYSQFEKQIQDIPVTIKEKPNLYCGKSINHKINPIKDDKKKPEFNLL